MACFLAGVYPSTLTGAAFKQFYNPYNYGHIWELSIGKNNKERFQKIYSLPRVSSEIAYVMPDEKTGVLPALLGLQRQC